MAGVFACFLVYEICKMKLFNLSVYVIFHFIQKDLFNKFLVLLPTFL